MCGTIQNTLDPILQRHQENRKTDEKQMWVGRRDSPFYAGAKSNKNGTRKWRKGEADTNDSTEQVLLFQIPYVSKISSSRNQ